MISVNATFKWNERTRINLEKAPEKIMRSIARQTLDLTGSSKVVANSSGASYKLPPGHRSGQTERSMYENAVQGDYETGFYIGNFTDYASYVYEPRRSVQWTNPNTKTKWFEYIWKRHHSTIIETAIKENKI